ncbi:hypothetical protein [Miniphocaeibacter halophilus]|uniref:Uncharacterized protein n=1 Tax=Miniphocaeibacter halophilus TaxID=2931922 RepID=A0AC61MTD1_9FIRM|nr:hypothetical protein [Miniphocaeibacter halophilus]QQK08950.1 hypothetical protein JFY71_05280 [Miniphocaeibacter halophilus]
MKNKKLMVLGVVFILFAISLFAVFYTRNNKYSEYVYLELSPLDYSTEYGEFSLDNKNLKAYKIKTTDDSSEKILESKDWVQWEEHSKDKVFDDLERNLLAVGDNELTTSYTIAHTWTYYIPKDSKGKIVLSYFIEYDNLLYIVEYEDKEV